ncbi:PepSY-associated TM helix domain-containing protein [Flavobacterium sp. LHD-80]|uniref:PepSY-associated TM helix domain-containing protein n=1 Tax=Flavobacterium sp. LHD-80 TaxID=3071411 RepID=UPI0027DF5695|nr:PepSY-associated TM helix domain-containing protein [Flavobacterium sp. LHD-80]MDQ6469867.1 PepSY-associated TM helix domain-containing protein [Flavobacterium sp. LHD-80]
MISKQIKNTARQIHLWLGLATGIIVFIISITGCIYVFEEEIRSFSKEEKLYVPIQEKPFVGLEKIVSNFQKQFPKDKITSIKINQKIPNAAVELSTKKKTYFFNPYDAALIGNEKQDWLTVVRKLHTELLLGEAGSFIQRWAVVIFALMLITGLILWFPLQIRSLKQSLTIKWKGTFKRVNYDLHNVLGFYASFFLIVIVFTGLFFAFKEVKNAAAFVTGTKINEGREVINEPILEKESLAARYDRIYKTENKNYPGANTVTFSIKKGKELRLRMLYPYKWSRKQNTFYFDPKTGQMLRYKLYEDFNTADTIEASNYDIHTGRFFGLFGKIIAFLASLIAASLPITGFIIWLKKKKKTKKKSPAKTVNKKLNKAIV